MVRDIKPQLKAGFCQSQLIEMGENMAEIHNLSNIGPSEGVVRSLQLLIPLAVKNSVEQVGSAGLMAFFEGFNVETNQIRLIG